MGLCYSASDWNLFVTLRPRKPSGPKPADRHPRPTGQRTPPRAAQSSVPEIRTRFEPVGRETLAAIAEELAGVDPSGDQVIKPSSGAFGRDTLAAIESELMPEKPAAEALGTPARRERRQTLGFEHRREASTSTPQDSRALALTSAERPGPKGPRSHSTDGTQEAKSARAPAEVGGEPACDVFEMVTFVVRGDLARLSSSKARQDFVAERLIHRLPIKSMAEVDRIDVTPWTVHGTVIVRVWCLVPPA